MIHFLTTKDVINIHDRMISVYGGLEGYSDAGRIESMITRILNRHVYEGEHDAHVLAAAYLLAIARGHCFNDANKRTAFASAMLFLRRNGIVVHFSEEHEELTVRTAKGDMGVWEIADVLRVSQ
ncbi:type II toxin-antitoxin system death-on-curing family toxin [Klebsiella michiganensis]|uniref:type II toxin-antitoxin system death-on-curing family toxin n=1 Tax=Klebsiella michiganensis TaxID=1134687 RepID=UPI002571110B|nr:type II toxin-antitoxin system death-on-curing family toxin [Klebsiella michiganensis]MDL4454985.1 type II toxin-antitoxin system death-on-curing family toxin [Klebsiella michiganensis]